MDLEPGTLITPTVRLVRPLAAGGMGTVWIADHTTLHTQVAVKIMMSELTSNEEVAERFSREAAASARVKSPHVVQVFDHGITASGLPFIVMELLEGCDLAQLLEIQTTLAPAQLSDIVSQACKGLSRAHAAGVVHRDIKPDNLFLCDAEGNETFVKILDFGIARSDAMPAAKRVTMPGAVFGTPHYMSPEQLVGTPVDSRTDLWSIGIVAYEALTGALPYDTDNIGALAVAAHAPLPPPSSKRADLSPAIDAWFARACAVDVAQRYASANELAQGLREAIAASELAVVPVVAAPPSALDRTVLSAAAEAAPVRSSTLIASSTRIPGVAPARSTPTLAVAAGVAVLVVIGLVWFGTKGPSEAAVAPPPSIGPAVATSTASAVSPRPADSSPWAPIASATAASSSNAPAASAAPRHKPAAGASATSSGTGSHGASSKPKLPTTPTNYDDIR